METIACTRCKIQRSVDDFYYRKSDGKRLSRCKFCIREKNKACYNKYRKDRIKYQKRYYELHTKERLEYAKMYYEKYKDSLQAANKERNRRYREEWRAERQKHKDLVAKILAGDLNAQYDYGDDDDNK